MDEMWKTIANFFNYEVSNFGRVRNKKTGRIIRCYTKKGKYPFLRIYNEIGGSAFYAVGMGTSLLAGSISTCGFNLWEIFPFGVICRFSYD